MLPTQTLFILLCMSLQVHTAPASCFSCSYISHARYCDFYTQCEDDEVCFVKTTVNHNGHLMYTSGCMSNQTCATTVNRQRSGVGSSSHGQDICVECCQGDMCNNKGCGDHGPPPRGTRGPYCYQCDHLSDPSECDQVTICDTNEVCGVEESVHIEHQFSTGCKRRSECLVSPVVGREVNDSKKSLHLCHRCCDDDMCNNRCGESHEHVGSWIGWSDWGLCYGCPLGTRNRTRLCEHSGHCNGNSFEEKNCTQTCESCNSLYNAGHVRSGVYTIHPDDVTTFDVFCDMEHGNGGWIVLQHRFDDAVLFNRSFTDYENGFGTLDGEFWLGLKKMYILAHSSRKVRFNLQATNGTWMVLEYGDFSVDDANQQYTLHLSQHTTGFREQSFQYNSGERFYTYDRDNDSKCGQTRHGGWWYRGCTYININGKFGLNDEGGVMEESHNGIAIPMNKTLMMIQ